MRIAPRISYTKPSMLEAKGNVYRCTPEDLSLFGIKFVEDIQELEIGDDAIVHLELNDEVSLNGIVSRKTNPGFVVMFNEDPEVIANTVGKYLTQKIFESKTCPYCGQYLEQKVEICSKCGMYLDFSKKEVVKITKDLKLGNFISKLVHEKKVDYGSLCIEESIEMVGSSPKMKQVFALIRKYAQTDYPVLILGETGTGKELTARAIHERSRRKDKPFVVVNCAAIPEDLLEAELFGYEKGAFTGAHHRKIGRVETANGGTLFLDEIGDLPYNLQAKLLRFLQDGTFERLGGNETHKVDVRIIAATNVNLKKAIEEGRFRKDLYYRLASLSIELPPLRERGNDVIVLAKYFLTKFCKELGKTNVIGFTEEALELMKSYTWPGNIRELINVIRKACVLSDKNVIDVNDLDIRFENINLGEVEEGILNLNKHIENLEKELVKKAFILAGGNITKMASLLSVSRPKVYKLIEKYNIGRIKENIN